MTCVTFSEEEIATAWAARRKRQLRKLYSRNEYTRLLRLFKKRGMIVAATSGDAEPMQRAFVPSARAGRTGG